MSEADKVSRRRFIKYAGGAAVVVVAAAAGYSYLSTTSTPTTPTTVTQTSTATPASKGIIKVGVPAPVSGWFAASAEEMVRGVTMAAEDINAKGGLLGYNLQVLVGDAGTPNGPYTAESTQNAMTYLAGQGVDAMITGFLDAPVDVQTAAKLGIPYIHVDTYRGVGELISKDPNTYWMAWMADPDESLYGSSIPEFLQGLVNGGLWQPINKKAAILTIDLGYNQTIRGAFKQRMQELGWTINIDEVYSSQTSEWGSLLTKIRADPPAFIFFDDHVVADEASFLKQFLQQPTQSLLWQQYSPSTPEYLKLTGDAANGVLWSTVVGLIPDAKGLEWANRYKLRWGVDPGFGNAPIAYDDTMLWAEAVKEAGDPKNYRAVAAAIGNTSYSGLCAAKYQFDPTTHNAKAGDDFVPTLTFQIQNLQQVLVAPTKYSKGKFVLPPWIK